MKFDVISCISFFLLLTFHILLFLKKKIILLIQIYNGLIDLRYKILKIIKKATISWIIT